jgi:hydroxyacylglutathione hydrolase
MLAELLPRVEHDQHRAGRLVRVQDDRVARAVRRGRRVKVPALHGRSVYAYTQPLFMPLVVDSFVMGPFQSNCYVVRAERGAPEAAVIDPGDDPTPLRLELAGLATRTAAILVTHSDVDHIGGVAALAEGTGAEVWAPSGEVDALKNGQTRGGMRVPPYDPEHEVGGGDEVSVAGITFDVVDVPGHSVGHIAFYADGHLFSGDLLFAGSVGRVDLPGGDWDTLLASVRALLDRFPGDTIVHPGHGPATTLERELRTNPFLRDLRAEDS